MQVIFELIRTVVAPAAQWLLALTGAYLFTLWVVLILWTFRDVESRSRSVVTQVFATLLVVFFFLPGLLLYLILRPRESLDEAYQRALQDEYLLQDLDELPLCPTCRRYVQGDFVLCPHCHTRLRDNCPTCERLVDLRWSVCPYCSMGLPGPDEREVQADAEAPAARLPEWVSPALAQLRSRVARLRSMEGGRGPAPSPVVPVPPPSAIEPEVLIEPAALIEREALIELEAPAAGSNGRNGHAPEPAVAPRARSRPRARKAVEEAPVERGEPVAAEASGPIGRPSEPE